MYAFAAGRAARLEEMKHLPTEQNLSKEYACAVNVNDLAATRRYLLSNGVAVKGLIGIDRR